MNKYDKDKLISADKETKIIQVKDGTRIICSEAFDNVRAKKVILPEGVEELEPNAFLRARHMEEVILPSTLRKVGDYAFHFCDSLKKIEFHDNVNYLGHGAFYGCTRLEEIHLNGDFCWNENWIDSSPFQYMASIKKFVSKNKNFIVYDDMLFSADKTILFRCPVNKKQVSLPSNLVVIANEAFNYCRYLRAIELP